MIPTRFLPIGSSRRAPALFVAFCAAFLWTSPAHASLFTLADYTVTLNASEPGLVLWSSDILPNNSTFELNTVGQSFTTALFRIGTTETQLNWDDLWPHTIDVNFNFTTPPPPFGGEANGITGAFQVRRGQPFGYVLWNNPLEIAFGTTGLLGVSLENETFPLPGAANVNATFTLLRADSTPTAAVPEPSSLLLVGSGAAALMIRRRSTRKPRP